MLILCMKITICPEAIEALCLHSFYMFLSKSEGERERERERDESSV